MDGVVLEGASSVNQAPITGESVPVAKTPVSIVCGLTRAAREGILFKGGAYLEELGRIRTFFFDKTGTLTLGKPEVVAVGSFRGRSEQEVLRLAAAIESRSEHPIAEAILAVARNSGTSQGRHGTTREGCSRRSNEPGSSTSS